MAGGKLNRILAVVLSASMIVPVLPQMKAYAEEGTVITGEEYGDGLCVDQEMEQGKAFGDEESEEQWQAESRDFAGEECKENRKRMPEKIKVSWR